MSKFKSISSNKSKFKSKFYWQYSNSNIPTSLYHPNFDYGEKTLILDSENIYNELYYCHKIVNSNDILVNYGRLLVFTDDKANASTGLLNSYAINYNLYVIEDGKLFNAEIA